MDPAALCQAGKVPRWCGLLILTLMNKFLVTGASGFLGSHLVEKLKAQAAENSQGLSIRVLSRSRNRWEVSQFGSPSAWISGLAIAFALVEESRSMPTRLRQVSGADSNPTLEER